MSKHDKFRKNPCTPAAAKKSAKSVSDTPIHRKSVEIRHKSHNPIRGNLC